MKEFDFLIKKDSFIKLHPSIRIDILDYINMRKQCLPTLVKWVYIRSLVVSEKGKTLFYLSENYLNSREQRAIGSIESPVSLFEWILKNVS